MRQKGAQAGLPGALVPTFRDQEAPGEEKGVPQDPASPGNLDSFLPNPVYPVIR